MNDKLKEEMSALVDGELESRSTRETIDVLLQSDELQLHWSRCHVVRDVLRHKVYPDAGDQLRDRVRAKLADEALHFPPRRLMPRGWRGTLKPVAGLALAASVAVVAILAIRGPQQLPGPPQTVRAPATRVVASTASTIIPVSTTAEHAIRPGALKRLQWNTTEPAVANRLNAYLVNHSEHLDGPMSGIHPYARIVGYDTTGQR